MTGFSWDVVAFDLDGTLLDTSGDLAAAVNHALEGAGRPTLPAERIRPMIGGGARHMLAQGMEATGGCTEAELDELQERLLAFYRANIAVHTRPFPGAVEALDALAAQGVRLGVMTNKLEGLARDVLGQLGLIGRFDAIVGGDTLGPGTGKPKPDALLETVRRCGGGRAAYVGDSRYDVEGARAASLPVVVVGFGFTPVPAASLGADAVIARYDELLPTLTRLGAAA